MPRMMTCWCQLGASSMNGTVVLEMTWPQLGHGTVPFQSQWPAEHQTAGISHVARTYVWAAVGLSAAHMCYI